MERKSPEQLYGQMEAAKEILGTDFFYDENRTKESLAEDEKKLKEKYPFRYEEYLKILRTLALKRKFSAKSGEENFEIDDEDNFNISEEETEKMGQEFVSARKYIRMTNNLEKYIDSYETENPAGSLREHQQDCFKDLLDFLNRGKKRGRIIMHTGSGKTAIFVELTKALSDFEGEYGIAPIRTLVVTSTIDLVKQTVGFDSEGNRKKGFAKFAPDISTTSFYSKNKDLTGQAVVTTDQSFINLMEQEKIDACAFDLIIFDEADKALGEKTSAKLREIISGKENNLKNREKENKENDQISNSIIIGLTATGNRFEEDKNKDLFPELIHELNLREGIELGTAAHPRGFLYNTDFEFSGETITPNGEYKNLEALDKEARNKAGVNIAASFIEKGISGIISCLPGDHIAHAKKIATMLNERIIIDPKNKEKRNARAQYIGDDISSDERDKYYEAFEKGEIDCFTYVDALNRGWDNPKAKFSIHLRPIRSLDLATQRAGRVLRPDGKGSDAYFVEFKDKFGDPSKEPCAIFNILGIKEFKQGARLLERKDKSESSLNERKTEEYQLPQELLEKLNIKLDVVMELGNEIPNAEKLNSGAIKYKDEIYMTIGEIAKIYGFKKEEIENLISENSQEPLNAGCKNYYMADEIVDLFLRRQYNPHIFKEYLSIKTISEATGVSFKNLKNIVRDSAGKEYKFGEVLGMVKGRVISQKKAVPFLFGAKNLDDATIEKLLREIDDPKSVIEICESENIGNGANDGIEYLLRRLKNIAGVECFNSDDIVRLLSSLARQEEHLGVKRELEKLQIHEFIPGAEEKLLAIKSKQRQYGKIGKECDRLLNQLEVFKNKYLSI
ncbi:MAG: DEAD/DEAH box helicase family protein [bacterium]